MHPLLQKYHMLQSLPLDLVRIEAHGMLDRHVQPQRWAPCRSCALLDLWCSLPTTCTSMSCAANAQEDAAADAKGVSSHPGLEPQRPEGYCYPGFAPTAVLLSLAICRLSVPPASPRCAASPAVLHTPAWGVFVLALALCWTMDELLLGARCGLRLALLRLWAPGWSKAWQVVVDALGITSADMEAGSDPGGREHPQEVVEVNVGELATVEDQHNVGLSVSTEEGGTAQAAQLGGGSSCSNSSIHRTLAACTWCCSAAE